MVVVFMSAGCLDRYDRLCAVLSGQLQGLCFFPLPRLKAGVGGRPFAGEGLCQLPFAECCLCPRWLPKGFAGILLIFPANVKGDSDAPILQMWKLAQSDRVTFPSSYSARGERIQSEALLYKTPVS